jgi:hypothetical protein
MKATAIFLLVGIPILVMVFFSLFGCWLMVSLVDFFWYVSPPEKNHGLNPPPAGFFVRLMFWGIWGKSLR